MDKRGQISLFIVLGIALLLIVGLISLSKLSSTPVNTLAKAELQQEGLKIREYVSSCLKEKLSKSQTLGLKPELKEVQEEYIKETLSECADLSQFEKNGLQIEKLKMNVDVAITSQVLAVKVTYPIIIRKGQDSINLENFNEYIKRETKTTLIQDEFGTTETKSLLSGDKKAELKISSGVRATKDGYPIGELFLNILDKNFNNLENSMVSGGVVYEALPDRAEFSEPIQIIIEYDPDAVPPGMENQLSIAYYDEERDLWIGLESEVDVENNKITAFTTHFTKFAVVVGCGTQTTTATNKKSCKDAQGKPKPQGSFCANPGVTSEIYYCDSQGKEATAGRTVDPLKDDCEKKNQACKTDANDPNYGYKGCQPKASSTPPTEKIIQTLDVGYVYRAPCYTTDVSGGCPMWVIKKKDGFVRTEEQAKEAEKKEAQHTNENGEDGPIYAPEGREVKIYLDVNQKQLYNSLGECKNTWDASIGIPTGRNGYLKVKDAGSTAGGAQLNFKMLPKGNTCLAQNKPLLLRVVCDDECKDFKLNSGKEGKVESKQPIELGTEYTVTFEAGDLKNTQEENTISMTVVNKYEACSGARAILEITGTGALEKCENTAEPQIKSCVCGNKNALVAYKPEITPDIFLFATKTYDEIDKNTNPTGQDIRKALKASILPGAEVYCQNNEILKSKREVEEETEITTLYGGTFNAYVKDEEIKKCCSDVELYPDISNKQGKEGCEILVCKKNENYIWVYTENEFKDGKMVGNQQKCPISVGGDEAVFKTNACGLKAPPGPSQPPTPAPPSGTPPSGTPGTPPVIPPPQPNICEKMLDGTYCSEPGKSNKGYMCRNFKTSISDANVCSDGYVCFVQSNGQLSCQKACEPACESNQKCNTATGKCEIIDTTKPCDSSTYKSNCENGVMTYCANYEYQGNYLKKFNCGLGCSDDGTTCKEDSSCATQKADSKCIDGKNVNLCVYYSDINKYFWTKQSCGNGECISPSKELNAMGGMCYEDKSIAPKEHVQCNGRNKNDKVCGGSDGKTIVTCTGDGKGIATEKPCGDGCENGQCKSAEQDYIQCNAKDELLCLSDNKILTCTKPGKGIPAENPCPNGCQLTNGKAECKPAPTGANTCSTSGATKCNPDNNREVQTCSLDTLTNTLKWGKSRDCDVECVMYNGKAECATRDVNCDTLPKKRCGGTDAAQSYIITCVDIEKSTIAKDKCPKGCEKIGNDAKCKEEKLSEIYTKINDPSAPVRCPTTVDWYACGKEEPKRNVVRFIDNYGVNELLLCKTVDGKAEWYKADCTFLGECTIGSSQCKVSQPQCPTVNFAKDRKYVYDTSKNNLCRNGNMPINKNQYVECKNVNAGGITNGVSVFCDEYGNACSTEGTCTCTGDNDKRCSQEIEVRGCAKIGDKCGAGLQNCCGYPNSAGCEGLNFANYYGTCERNVDPADTTTCRQKGHACTNDNQCCEQKNFACTGDNWPIFGVGQCLPRRTLHEGCGGINDPPCVEGLECRGGFSIFGNTCEIII